ncbi:MAG: division/cell wall cluster transcriptional repressor MraZ [Minisyncoccota bacterium]
MLIGEYTHTLDPKKRLSMPSKFRKELGKKVVVTKGFEKCLFVYQMKGWQSAVEKLRNLPTGDASARGIGRFFFGSAVETEVDSLGRILIPDFLKEFSGLNEKVVVVGMYERVELWNEGAWKEYKERVEHDADALAGKFGEAGTL